MKQDIRHVLGKAPLFFDGASGTLLQSRGLPAGKPPSDWALENPSAVLSLHREYLAAGCRVISSNTFGVNSLRDPNAREVVKAALAIAKEAISPYPDAYLALDAGPTGRLLAPLGDLPFEEAVALYREVFSLAEEGGADLILIETMSDLYEAKAAVLAAKEVASLPILVSFAFSEDGKLLTGASPLAAYAAMQALGVSAFGLNCATGPEGMEPLLRTLAPYAAADGLPLFAAPNAGLPRLLDGKTVYDLSPEAFASALLPLCEAGASALGGCCGTTPAHLEAAIKAATPLLEKALCENVSQGGKQDKKQSKDFTLVSSSTTALNLRDGPFLIGERLNPTGKPKLKAALREGRMDVILREAVAEEEAGADLLDVNVGLPGLDEPRMMQQVLLALAEVTTLPLVLDSSDPSALEAGLRLYPGKALVNSVNGSKKSMDAVFPLVKKYGGALIALTLDEAGIPETVEGRLAIADKILAEGEAYGLTARDFLFDPLALAVSADKTAPAVTLGTVKALSERGLSTSLGISNISFGLPDRERVNASALAAALALGLTAAISNPLSPKVKEVFTLHRLLSGKDEGCLGYLDFAAENPLCENVSQSPSGADGAPAGTAEKGAGAPAAGGPSVSSLSYAIEHGLTADAAAAAASLLGERSALELLEREVLPALGRVGEAFEKGRAFLPQLIRASETAKAVFDLLKERMPKNEAAPSGRPTVILATVEGDLHDIGKNIVKVVLESYGYPVLDLGRNVPKEKIEEALLSSSASFVGLSALMTTTVPAMKETIEALSPRFPHVRFLVGGAVLTRDLAESIRAHAYCADAMETVRQLERFEHA